MGLSKARRCGIGVFVAIGLMLSAAAHGQLKLNVGESKQKFTILPQRPGLNFANQIFVDLNHDGKDDILVGGDASYGGDDNASFFLLLSSRIRPENSPFDLSTQKADRRYDAASRGEFNDCIQLAKGDWNADGRQDVAIAGRSGVYIILGRDQLTTGTEQILRPDTVDIYLRGSQDGAGIGRQVAAADVNGDGKDDMVVADMSNVYVLFGGSAFGGWHNVPISSESADRTYQSWGSPPLGVGDLNRDGRADIMLAGGNTNRVFFTPATLSPHGVVDIQSTTADVTTLNFGGWTGYSSLKCADFDADGKNDLIVIDDGGFKTLGRKWNPPQSVDLATTYSVRVNYGGAYGGDVAEVADFNGDGIADIGVSEEYYGQIHVLFGRHFAEGSYLDVWANPEKNDVLLYNGGYHFSGGVFGRVVPGQAQQIAGGAWAEGNSYAGIIHVAFMRPDIHNAAVTPLVPTAFDDLKVAFASGWDTGQEVSYRWRRNGALLSGQTSSTLPHGLFVRKDVVTAEIVGKLPSISVSTTSVLVNTTIANSPPGAPKSVTILPAKPTADQDLRTSASKGTDPDGDSLVLRYKWYVNGTLKGTSSSLAKTCYRAGDQVMVETRCSDGTDTGPATTAWSLIRNSASATDNARILSVYMPTTIEPGKGFWIRVNVQNTGQTAWNLDWGYHLLTGLPDPKDLVPGSIVRPGYTYEFNRYYPGFSMPGNYTFLFQMENTGKGVFGQRVARDVLLPRSAAVEPAVWARY